MEDHLGPSSLWNDVLSWSVGEESLGHLWLTSADSLDTHERDSLFVEACWLALNVIVLVENFEFVITHVR